MNEPTQEAPPVLIEDLDQFVSLLTGWHSNKVAMLEHLLEIPEGTEMQVDGGDSVALTGDILAGFKAGLNVALMELGKLPFESAPLPDATH